MDVWEYFAQRESECAEMSVDCSGVDFYAEEGGGDQIGTMLGHVYFDHDTYLDVHERIEVHGNSIHRNSYAYFLVMEGIEIWGYERDPTHDPPVHRHTEGHAESLDAEPISFKRACKMAWREVSLREGAIVDDS